MIDRPIARGIDVPVIADPVDTPIISYGAGPTAIHFPLRDGGWGRVTFENFDALRVCRGEYEPYESDWQPDQPVRWVSIVSPSPWLVERHAYEKHHYGASYRWGNDVDEMLRDFAHYVFSFHDQFVEVLCAGIWFDVAAERFSEDELPPGHPLARLPGETTERFDAKYWVRRDPRTHDRLLADAQWCSQKVWQLGSEPDDAPSWTLSVRVRDGSVRATLAEYFGRPVATFDRIPALDEVRPLIRS